MARNNNATNRFGPSSYVVGTTLGDGCNFTLVQDAINQAVADGFNTANPTTVLVRPGIHTGTFTMAPGIYVVGVSNGSVNVSNVVIAGSIIIDATTAGGITYGLENLFISDGGTTVTTINAGTVFLDIGNCSIFGDTALTISNVSGTFSQVTLRDCTLNGLTRGLAVQEHNILTMSNCTMSGAIGVTVRNTAQLYGKECTITGSATYGCELTGSNTLELTNSSVTSIEEAFYGSAVGDNIKLYHCTVNSTAASTFYIDNVFFYDFYDLALTGTALNSNALATTYIDWQPHAGTAGTATLPGGVRGTACFKNTDFTVTNGFVELSASAAGTYPVDNGGPGVPLAGAMSFLGTTAVDFPITSGIETHVGATTNEVYFEDRRWVSSLIVDPDATVGLRGTFTTITAALAAALPLQTIYVRPGIYTESFTTVDLVNIIGLTTPSGGVNGLASTAMNIDGTITGGTGSSTIQNLRINTAAGPAISMTNGGSSLTIIGCTIQATTFALEAQAGATYIDNSYLSGGVNGVAFTTTPGAVVTVRNSRLDGPSNGVQFDVVGQFTATDSEIVSNGAGGIFDNAGADITLVRTIIDATGAAALDMQVAGTADISYCTLISPIQTINFNAVPPVVTSYHNTHICTGAASEYVVGPGSYSYGDDVVNPITFAGIDPATVKTVYGWRPWADVVSSPGTNSDKGVASFDSAQFTSTSGFIQLSGGNSPPFTDVSGVQSASRNQGYYATAATTFTLDSLALQGDLVIIYADTAAALVVTANAGQQIRLGTSLSAVAGTATSTAIGDSLTLRFRASNSHWECVSSFGNWTVV